VFLGRRKDAETSQNTPQVPLMAYPQMMPYPPHPGMVPGYPSPYGMPYPGQYMAQPYDQSMYAMQGYPGYPQGYMPQYSHANPLDKK